MVQELGSGLGCKLQVQGVVKVTHVLLDCSRSLGAGVCVGWKLHAQEMLQ